jgi:hypothetical protein
MTVKEVGPTDRYEVDIDLHVHDALMRVATLKKVASLLKALANDADAEAKRAEAKRGAREE